MGQLKRCSGRLVIVLKPLSLLAVMYIQASHHDSIPAQLEEATSTAVYKKAGSNPPKDLKKVTSFSINPSLESLYFTARDARDWGEIDTTIVWHCSPLPTYRERE